MLPKKGKSGSEVVGDIKVESPLGQWLSGALTCSGAELRLLSIWRDAPGLGLPLEYSNLLVADGFDDIDTLLVIRFLSSSFFD